MCSQDTFLVPSAALKIAWFGQQHVRMNYTLSTTLLNNDVLPLTISPVEFSDFTSWTLLHHLALVH